MALAFPEQEKFESSLELNPDVIAYDLLVFYLENIVKYRGSSQKFGDQLARLAPELPQEWLDKEVKALRASCQEHNSNLLKKVLSTPNAIAFLHYVVYLLTKRIEYSPTEHSIYQGLGKLIGFNVKVASPDLETVAFTNDPMAQWLYLYEDRPAKRILGLLPKKEFVKTVWLRVPKAVLDPPAVPQVQAGLDLRCENCQQPLGEITLAPCKCLLCKACIASDRNARCARCGAEKLAICQNLRTGSTYFAANEQVREEQPPPILKPVAKPAQDEDEELNLARVISYYEEIQNQIAAAQSYVTELGERKARGELIQEARITLLSLQAHPTTVANLSSALTQARIGTSISINQL